MKGVKMNTIIVIGGGASGMTAAISAARHGAKVIIIEHMDRVGKKILSTGNGKCNYTNRKQGARFYRGQNPSFVLPVFAQFGFTETIAFFRELGIFPLERGGYFYPASGQAASVLDALRLELKRLRVQILTGCKIDAIHRQKQGFCVRSNQGEFWGDACIIACGGKAFPKSGSDGSAFLHIEKLGHSMTEMTPALAPMKAKQPFFKSIAGIRADISIKLYIEKELACQDRGEVQLTDYGISGIPAFQVSRYAAKALKHRQRVQALLDFAPYLSAEEVNRELFGRFFADHGKTAEEALIGWFPKKLIWLFLKENGIPLQAASSRTPKTAIVTMAAYIKGAAIDICGVKGFEFAQASAGGVHTEEIKADTLESSLLPGLYFAGEVIDLDGMCGGYNLQWAWSSGYVAGMCAAYKGHNPIKGGTR